MTPTRLEQLKELKDGLGPLTFLDFSDHSLAEGHRALSAALAKPARRTLVRRLEGMDQSRQARLLRQARRCRAILEQRRNDPALPPELRAAIADGGSGYLACLDAWAAGLALEDFTHPALLAELDGRPVNASDVALWMQHDNTGCQTGLYRLPDGSGIFWHAEEDIHPGRLEGLPIVRLACPGLAAGQADTCWHAFTYPDLLPGPAFAWREDGYVQAVDLLIVRNPPEFEQAVLVNVVAWLALRLGSALLPAEIAAALAPFYDGYALNFAGHRMDQVYGGKVEFAGSHVLPTSLGQETGSRLFQVNTFCQRDDPELLAIEQLPARRDRFFRKRYRRTFDWLDRHPVPSEPQAAMAHFLRLLGSRQGGEGCYSNRDVRAYFLAWLAPQGVPGSNMQIWLGSGPVLPGEQPIQIS